MTNQTKAPAATPGQDTPYSKKDLSALTTEVRWVVPEEARQLRRACHFERQRDIRGQHVKRLADEMDRGWFLAGTPIWLCVLPDKSMAIVNGNHTLEAVAASGKAMPLTFVYQQVASLDEAAKAYACFDIQSTRTWGQAAHAAGIDAGLPDPGKTIAAIGVIQGGFTGNLHTAGLYSRQARFQLLDEYRGAAHLIHGLLRGTLPRNQSYVIRAAVYAVALVTARWQPSAAEEFWGGLLADDGLRANDPRKVLLRYLSSNTANAGMRRDQAVAAAISWNHHYAGQTMEIMRPSSALSFELEGTPWARKGPLGPVSLPRYRKQRRERSRVALGRRVTGGETEDVALYVGA